MSSDSAPGQGRDTADGTGITRTFGWQDMWLPPEEDPRSDSSPAGERATLIEYLRNYRLTLELKCSGLDAAGLACRSVPPSDLSLLGLVRHMADVEYNWFRRVLAGQDTGWPFWTDDDPEAAFTGAVPDPQLVDAAWAAWREEVRFAEQFVEDAPDLEVTGTYTGGVVSLREVLVHMIEEYARHMGHADLLRERVDGRVGQ
jgi:Protein of unknown function (DUF664)